MAFADSAGLQAAQAFLAGAPDLIAKLQAAGMADGAALVQGMHIAATDLISQGGSAIQADLAPVISQLTAFNKNIADVVALLTRMLDEGVQVGGRRQ